MTAEIAEVFPASTGTHVRVPIEVTPTRAVVLRGPWLPAVTNSDHASAVPPLEDQFAAFADEALEWADLSLPAGAELLVDE